MNVMSYSRNEENLLHYEGRMVHKKDRERVLMPDEEDNTMVEILEVIIEAESSLTNKSFHERHNKCRNIHRKLGHLLNNDRCVSRFKMIACNDNIFSKECLDNASIGRAAIKALTNVSDNEGNLEVENYLTNEMLEQQDSVIDKLMAIDRHTSDQKSTSTDMLRNI